MPNSPQRPQWQRLSFYHDQRAVQFATREEVYHAIDLFCRDDELQAAPYAPAGRNTLIVAAEVVPYLKARGLTFTESKVLTGRDIPSEDLRPMQHKHCDRLRRSP